MYAYVIVSVYVQDASTDRYKSRLSNSSNNTNNNIESSN